MPIDQRYDAAAKAAGATHKRDDFYDVCAERFKQSERSPLPSIQIAVQHQETFYGKGQTAHRNHAA